MTLFKLMMFWNWRVWSNRPLKSKIYWWFIIIVSMFLASQIIYDTVANKNEFIMLSLPGIYMFSGGLAIGMIIWRRWFSKNNCRPIMDGAFESISTSQAINNFVMGSLFIIITAVVILSLMLFRSKSTQEVFNFWFNKILTDFPGGLFTFITGAATLIGTLIAIQSIIEMKHTITSYPQLIERITELIDKAEDHHDGTQICCYSPLPGFWQITSDKVKENFQGKLQDRKRKIQIVCLKKIDHIKLLLTIAKIRNKDDGNKISGIELLDFQTECNNTLDIFENSKDNGFKAKPHYLEWSKMPYYYFFVSAHRAIIVTPFGLPIIDHDVLDSTCEAILENSTGQNGIARDDAIIKIDSMITKESDFIINSRKLTNKAHVATLGFETTDRSIIDSLQKQFRTLRDI